MDGVLPAHVPVTACHRFGSGSMQGLYLSPPEWLNPAIGLPDNPFVIFSVQHPE
jgi:hypothetical protein